MTFSKNNTVLKIIFVVALAIVMTPALAHTALESSGLLYSVLHPLYSLDHLLARLLLGSVIVFLAHLITHSSQYKLEKIFGFGFAVSGVVMVFNF